MTNNTQQSQENMKHYRVVCYVTLNDDGCPDWIEYALKQQLQDNEAITSISICEVGEE